MKVKTLVAIGVSSLLAVSIAYATPSLNAQLVDDATTSTQPAATDMNVNNGALDSTANPGAAPSDATATTDTNNTNPGSDEDTQDTATGDSDY